MYTKIMVAINGSPSSTRAFDEGLKMAGTCGARLLEEIGGRPILRHSGYFRFCR